jgi:hypothetical protein
MSSDPAPAKNRNWLWTFIGIAFVAIVLLTWLALFIQEQLKPAVQLKLEQLQSARRLWQTADIKDYQMLYSVQRGGGQAKDHYFVDVRAGKVLSVIMNGKDRLPEDQLEYHSMTGLLNNIELFLKGDAPPGSPQTFCRGYFDSRDGHLMLFQRQVLGGPERVEIKVEEFRPGGQER